MAPVLRDKGKLTVTSRDPATAKGEQRDDAIALDTKLKGAPEIYGKVQVQLLDPPNGLSFGPDNSADLVLTFRNVHNFYGDGHGDRKHRATRATSPKPR